LLYWDGVKRIVPSGYSPQDSQSVKMLIAEGVIESVDPDSYTQGAADEFIPTLEQLIGTRGHLGRARSLAVKLRRTRSKLLCTFKKWIQELLRC
jgi:hypothetical protein